MTQARDAEDGAASKPQRTDLSDVLEAFNAGDAIKSPGEPPEPVISPADDADAPAPG